MKLCCLLSVLVIWQMGVENSGFEVDAAGKGWKFGIEKDVDAKKEPQGGAVEVTESQAKKGKRSLYLKLDRYRRARVTARQEIEARPGGRYKIACQAKGKGLEMPYSHRQEAGIALVFLDSFDRIVHREVKNARAPDSDWHVIGMSVVAPERARKAYVELICSKNGELWLDEVMVHVTGGLSVPPSRTLFEDSFEGRRKPGKEWTQRSVEGPNRGRRSVSIKVIKDAGLPDSPGALVLDGDRRAGKWKMISREAALKPGDEIALGMMMRGEQIFPRNDEGIGDVAIQLRFLDKNGEAFGAPRSNRPPRGSFDWKPVELRTVAPEGAHYVRVDIVLGRPGKLFIDKVRLIMTGGAPR